MDICLPGIAGFSALSTTHCRDNKCLWFSRVEGVALKDRRSVDRRKCCRQLAKLNRKKIAVEKSE